MKKTLTLLIFLAFANCLSGQEKAVRFSVEVSCSMLNTFLFDPPFGADYVPNFQLNAIVVQPLASKHHLRVGLSLTKLDFYVPLSPTIRNICDFECPDEFYLQTMGFHFGHEYDLATAARIRLSLINAMQVDFPIEHYGFDSSVKAGLSYSGEASTEFRLSKKLFFKVSGIFRAAVTKYGVFGFFPDQKYYPYGYGMSLGFRRHF